MRLNRRRWLQGLGLGLVGAPFLARANRPWVPPSGEARILRRWATGNQELAPAAQIGGRILFAGEETLGMIDPTAATPLWVRPHQLPEGAVFRPRAAADIAICAGRREVGIIVRYLDPTNFLVARLRSMGTANPELRLFQVVGGVATQLGATYSGADVGATRLNAGIEWAVRVEDDRTHVTALVHESEVPELLSDLEDNGQVALGFSRPTDHRSCQLKGTFAGSRAATPSDQVWLVAQVDGFAREPGRKFRPYVVLGGRDDPDG